MHDLNEGSLFRLPSKMSLPLAFPTLASTILAFAISVGCPGAQEPLSKSQLQQLVNAGLESDKLVTVVEQRGIDFDPTGEFIASIRQRGDQLPLVKMLCKLALENGDEPFDRTLLSEEVMAGTDNGLLVEGVFKRGISFQPTKGYLDTLESAGATEALLKAIRDANPKPLTDDQVLALVAQGVANGRVAMLVKLRGLAQKPSDEFLATLRIAGADESLLNTLRGVKFTTGKIVVKTILGARVHLDGVALGVTGSEGTLRVERASPGGHSLKVTFESKPAQTRSIWVTAGETLTVDVPF
jgi:hypothetical protein